jgi:CheY-like chemotaxis protein
MIDDAIKIMDAISRFFAGMGWPLAFIVGIIWLAPSLRELISRIDKISGKIAGNEFAVSTLQRNSANQLAAAIARQDQERADPTKSINVNRQFSTSLERALQTTSRIQVDRTIGKVLLWVDDNPTNNIFEKQALAALGMTIKDAISTEEAMGLLNTQHFDVIISDMKRGNNDTAGYDLLQKARASGITAPLIFYTARANEKFVAEARQRGAFGETNNPEQLITLVASALGAN